MGLKASAAADIGAPRSRTDRHRRTHERRGQAAPLAPHVWSAQPVKFGVTEPAPQRLKFSPSVFALVPLRLANTTRAVMRCLP